MRLKQVAVVLGMSEVWLKRALKESNIEPGRWGCERRGTQPIEFAELGVLALVLRFLRSDGKIPFAIKAKMSYNYLRWAVRQDLYIPKEVRRVAELFDPLRWKYDKHSRHFFTVLRSDGSVFRTKLLPSEKGSQSP